MSYALTYTRACMGVKAPLVTVETHISSGLPAFHIVGLADTAVRESKDRVRSALLNNGFKLPTRRITVNLAPADLPKDGSRYDLSIALGILIASKQLQPTDLSGYEWVAELALSGALRAVKSILPAAMACQAEQRAFITAMDSADVAALTPKLTCYGATHLNEVIRHINNSKRMKPHVTRLTLEADDHSLDIAQVQGQEPAKRALTIAAAGQHHILFTGPPGAGKTMLAQRLPTILPTLSEQSRLEVMAMHLMREDQSPSKQYHCPPFRAPHHGASDVSIVGGGQSFQPGEVSLAHRGVLFLDELPEFSRATLEALRQPLQEGRITLSRVKYRLTLPACFQLIVAMNPCPCGYLSDPTKVCTCTPRQIQHYQAKLSGPLLDRIDLHVHLPKATLHADYQFSQHSETSSTLRAQVEKARHLQHQRAGKTNATLNQQELRQYVSLSKPLRKYLLKSLNTFNLSARAHDQILRTARTIADLDHSQHVTRTHLNEAILLRRGVV